MKNIFKNALLSTVVFGMAIASGFAMDNNPPAEPVKKVVETEVVTEEAPEVIIPGVAYMDALGNCVGYYMGPLPPNCSTTVTLNPCTQIIGGIVRHLRQATFDTNTNKWTCGALLYRIPGSE